ncbi:Histidine phosphatase superfamily (branch 1) [Novymonas esmeraldas]|uniref:Histidine phosphatase superfamily (Branch 1) n=1 Tax=Novymonas esmeraldas TaxID=1808958 RepID=A0AAW0F2X5_9TRYP
MFFWMVIALLVAIAIVVTPAGRVAVAKGQLYAHGAVFMVKAKDLPKTYRGTNFMRMNSVGDYTGGKRTIRVVFIRHGQSVWNSLFNSINVGLPVRMVKAVVREFTDFFTDPFASCIIDSPLSSKGKKEAQDLSSFMRTAKSKISFDPATSVVVSSNLRRAMETALVGVAPRLTLTQERIVLDSALQEGSQNIDAQSLSTEPGKIAPCKMGPITDPMKLPTVFNPCLNAGNRVAGVDVYQRMDQFVMHLFGGKGDASLAPAAGGGNAALKEVIVVGHSGYFRNFFHRFLPPSSTHIAKRSKMQNCAVVTFELTRNESNGEVLVDESTVKVLYKGFK